MLGLKPERPDSCQWNSVGDASNLMHDATMPLIQDEHDVRAIAYAP